ncbi:bifunctional phosphopantothenoylcysteine decarboxylase/phosphopantothenate--cysteine ligase CoaBC [Alphaproteobacteria bacterium]|nr:bifunctional phosphopantothenoylcysteine decarboxylase/phosphopantothenate--cysteine ligase CoaBC [Alphaproteobacteria bacterium]
MKKKRILLIVTGGVASYKALELLRLLVKDSFDLECVLTDNTKKFIHTLMFESLLGKKVFTELFSLNETSEMNHIQLANNFDLILVVPATANFIGKISNGLADDLASTILMATKTPTFFAPGMNVNMWENPVVKKNLQKLKDIGYRIINPLHGKLACGQIGVGKLVEINEIHKIVRKFFYSNNLLKGKKAIVTSGPSIEKLDPVRYLSNFSSGLQGYKIAEQLSRYGAETTLISGPTSIEKPDNVKIRNVDTGIDFLEASVDELPADIFISVAAICDFKMKKISKHKIKKNKNLEKKFVFEKNVDVLKEISSNNMRPSLVIGFSAETEELVTNTQRKLKEKRCDWFFGNLVSNNQAFNTDRNKVCYVNESNIINWPMMKKEKVAEKIVKEISLFFNKN